MDERRGKVAEGKKGEFLEAGLVETGVDGDYGCFWLFGI